MVCSCQKSWQTAREQPSLRRCWLWLASTLVAFTVLMLVLIMSIEGLQVMLRCLPGTILCIAWLLSDLFWHLGLNRRTSDNYLLPMLSWATVVTEVRGWIAAFLVGRVLAGIHTVPLLAFSLYSLCVITDIVDGIIARTTKTQTKLGQILDSETDFCISLVMVFILVQDGLLASWLALVICLRFCIPLLAAIGSYFFFVHPIRFGSTFWGKGAGIATYSYLFVLLTSSFWHWLPSLFSRARLVVTLVLLIVAPVAQLRGYWKRERCAVSALE